MNLLLFTCAKFQGQEQSSNIPECYNGHILTSYPGIGTVGFNTSLDTVQVISGWLLWVIWPNQQCHSTQGPISPGCKHVTNTRTVYWPFIWDHPGEPAGTRTLRNINPINPPPSMSSSTPNLPIQASYSTSKVSHKGDLGDILERNIKNSQTRICKGCKKKTTLWRPKTGAQKTDR